MQNSGNISSFSVRGLLEPLISVLLLTAHVRFFICDNLVIGATTLPTYSGPAFFYHFWQGKVLRKRWYAIYTHPLSDEGLPKFSYYKVEQVMWPHFARSVRAPRVSPDDLVVSSAKLRLSTFIFTVLESFSLKNRVVK